MAEQEEDFSKLPLSDRFVHKNWKVRKEGYEAAVKELKTAQPSDDIVRDFISDSGIWKNVVGDSNVAAQAEGLNALNAFLEIAGTPGCTRTRAHTIQPIVEKGLTGRPAAKAAALEALLLYVELDKPDPVLEELIPLLSAKTPKVVVAALSALVAIYHAYGCKTVEPKPVIKLLPKVFSHTDKNVRAEAQNLTVEFYRWLKDAMKPLFWAELKPVQQTDLEKLFDKVKDEPPPRQERLLKSQQAAQEAAAEAAVPEEEAEEDEDAEIDLEPEFEAVDVFAKVPADFSERLHSSKWKDRKEALDELHTALNVPLIQEGPFDDIIRGLAKSMKDANVAVVTVAANCVELLAKGLRKSFGRYRSSILSPMLERLKEKKQSVTDALAAALDAVFSSTNLSDNLEEILEFFKHKTPQVKLESARFLVRCLKLVKEVPQPPELKSMVDSAKQLLGDSQGPPRDLGAEILGTLWKIMTDRNMLQHLEGIDDIKKNKIKEFCDQAEVKVKWKPKAAPPPKPAAAPPAGRKPALGKRPAAAVKKPAAAPARPATPPEEPAAPLAARPTSRPGAKAAPKSGLQPPSGLKMKRPGLPAAAAAAAAASPRRAPSASAEFSGEESPVAAPPARSGLAAPRSLAARPLGKPAAFNQSFNEPPPELAPAPQMHSSVLSNAERAELSDLRAEVEYLRSQNSELRTDKMKLNSQIHELQNQNAQLIEDHTRDVLGIKAKETQLVRARSDAEAAEERASSLSREVDRLKREVSRLGRQERESRDTPMEMHSQNYETNHTNGSSRYDSGRPAYGRTPGGLSYSSSREPSGEKENMDGNGERKLSPGYSHGHSNTPSMEQGSSGRASPAFAAGVNRSASGSRPASNLDTGEFAASSRASMSRTQSGDGAGGVESWRRAAEVTQNLKARIEMMKAKQQSLQRH